MQSADDSELLRQYAENHSDEAFATGDAEGFTGIGDGAFVQIVCGIRQAAGVL